MRLKGFDMNTYSNEFCWKHTPESSEQYNVCKDYLYKKYAKYYICKCSKIL